jgi:hypothetical protein
MAVEHFTKNPQSIICQPLSGVFVSTADRQRLLVTGDNGIYELALDEPLPRLETLDTVAQDIMTEWNNAFPQHRPHFALRSLESAILKLEQFLP